MRIFGAIALFLCLVASGCGGPTDLNSNRFSSGSGVGDAQFASRNTEPNKLASSFWDVQSLKASPTVEVASETTEGDVILKEITYDAPSGDGNKIRIFAYYAYPAAKKDKKLPAIVSVHGGGGITDKSQAIFWASQGYTALAMHLPGKGEGREQSRSEGPDMSNDAIFKVSPSAKDSYLYAAVNAVCRAVTMLADQKEVDRSRIGVVGYSWGGVIALLANGIDDRIAAACTLFGSGFLTEESGWVNAQVKALSKHDRKVWREHFDPSSYLTSQHGKMFFVSATQDTYFPLRSFIRTFEGAKCEKALTLVLNKHHEWDDATNQNISRWFDWALRSGPPLPSATVRRVKDKLEVKAEGSREVAQVSLVTTELTDYAKAVWKSADVEGKDGVWKADAPAQSAPYFVQVRDKDGATMVESVNLPK